MLLILFYLCWHIAKLFFFFFLIITRTAIAIYKLDSLVWHEIFKIYLFICPLFVSLCWFLLFLFSIIRLLGMHWSVVIDTHNYVCTIKPSVVVGTHNYVSLQGFFFLFLPSFKYAMDVSNSCVEFLFQYGADLLHSYRLLFLEAWDFLMEEKPISIFRVWVLWPSGDKMVLWCLCWASGGRWWICSLLLAMSSSPINGKIRGGFAYWCVCFGIDFTWKFLSVWLSCWLLAVVSWVDCFIFVSLILALCLKCSSKLGWNPPC